MRGRVDMQEGGFLYQNIVERVRADIISGKLKPGDRLPTVRALCKEWNCTPATVQRAYQELSRLGLILGRPGVGTRVADGHSSPPWESRLAQQASLRRAFLLNRAETFLLESINAGYSLEEVQQAMEHGIERWRVVKPSMREVPTHEICFCGSHDIVVNWLASHFDEICPGGNMRVNFTGSLGGLISLARGEVHVAGCHLWDAETDSYNDPFIRRLLPGENVHVLTLAQRQIGLLLPPGNPRRIGGLRDLAQPGLRFVNRQQGSGTRVWLDSQLSRLGLDSASLTVGDDKWTHTEVARCVASGEADAGIGLSASAEDFNLVFLPLTLETYDLVFLPASLELPCLTRLASWLASAEARKRISDFPGYLTALSGRMRIVGAGPSGSMDI